MADLTTLANEAIPVPARLPALEAPELSVEYLAKMKEIIEVLLGRRGSDWDRAATLRDLQALPVATASIDADAALRNSATYRSLVRQISDATQAAGYPDEIRAQLEQALSDLARERKAEIRTVENKIQTAALSMASRLSEITASLEGAAAGVREFDAAYADGLRAVAVRIETVAAALDTAGGGVIAQEMLEAVADAVEGLKAQWSLKIQTNPTAGQPPVIAGIDLSVTDPIAGPGTSALIFMAEAFKFLTQNGSKQIVTIEGDEIVFNGRVKASSLAVGFSGGLNKDPNFADYAGSWDVTASASVFGSGGSAPAVTYLGAPGGVGAFTFAKEMIPIDSTKTYVLSGSVYADPGNNRVCIFLVNFYDALGNRIASTGWGDANFSGYAKSFTPTTGDWHPYRDGVFGANSGGKTIPAAAKTCRIGVYLNAGGSSNTLMGVTALRLSELAGSDDIQDGVLSARHIVGDTLDVLAAYFGSVQLGIGGALWAGQTGYDIGNGLRLGTDGDGNPYLSMRSANGKYVRIRPSTNTFEMDGMKILNPEYSTFEVDFGGDITATGSGTIINMGTRTTSVSGVNVASVQWEYIGGGDGSIKIVSPTSLTTAFESRVPGLPGFNQGVVRCTVVATDGRTGSATRNISCDHF